MTAPTATPRPSPRAHVIGEIRRWISDGTLRIGQRLPSEYDLAERLGATRSTVHLAIVDLERLGILAPGEQGGRVVIDAAHPRSLMADTVAVLTDNPQVRGVDASAPGWASHVQGGAMDAIAAAGLHALCLQPAALVPERIARLIADPPRAVIALTSMIRSDARWEAVAALARAGVPVVADQDEPETACCDRVVSDQAAGCESLTRWLLARGHRRIQRVWHLAPCPRPPAWLDERDAGFMRAMAQAGIAPPPAIDARIASLAADPAEDLRLTVALLAGLLLPVLRGPERPDALMASSDGNVRPLALACRELGVDLPIVGYDHYWSEAHGGEGPRPLATVDKRNAAIGREMVRLVQERAAGRLGPAPVIRRVPPELVIVRS